MSENIARKNTFRRENLLYCLKDGTLAWVQYQKNKGAKFGPNFFGN